VGALLVSIPNVGLQRPLMVQTFRTSLINVTTAPLPLDPTVDKTKLITTFAVSNPVAGASVYIGNAGVTIPGGANPGFEIPAGTSPQFSIDQQGRQLYELQAPLQGINAGLNCNTSLLTIEGLPFVVWDLSSIFIVAVAATTVTVITFPTMYL